MLWQIAKKTYNFILNTLPDFAAVPLMYFRRFKRFPNFRNPKGFNEKIAWRKLFQRDPRFTTFADKIAVKDEVAKLVGKEHVIETLWTGERPEDIPFDMLPIPYILKATHTSGGNYFVRTAQDVDKAKIISFFRHQLSIVHWHFFREWGYQDVSPRLLAERVVEMPDGEAPEDYKFFVFDGRVHFIQYDADRFKEHRRNMYDRDWNLVPAGIIYPPVLGHIPKPPNFDEMVRIAEKIGAGFDFIRVDLYTTPKGVMFGETTFYPGGGIDPVTPPEWELKFGEPWKIKPYRA